MNDETKLADKKIQIQNRIRDALMGLRLYLRADRAALAYLDRIVVLVSPRMAYQDRGKDALSFLPNLHREKARTPEKHTIVFHEIAILLQRYWELIRTDQTSRLYSRLIRLEGWAKHGFNECEILGGPNIGYTLFDLAAQREGE